MSSFAPTNEDVPPLLDGGGKLEVWRIDGSAKTPVPKEDIGKFYSGDCYIVLYTYHQDYLCHWIGEDCNKVATSLNSNECFLLQSGSSIFTWHGNQSTHEQQQLAAEVAEFLKPGVSVKLFKEGTESSAFWLALGGKQSYISKEVPQEIVRDSTKATVNNPNHLIQGMYYEIEHNLLGDYADTLGMTNFVLVMDISEDRVQLWYPSPVSLKSFATSTEEIGPPFMDLPLDVEDSVAFLGRYYNSGDLTRARMDEGLSFFVPEKFLPEIVGFKVDLTPSYIRLASVGESVQSGMLNKDFALVSFTRFGDYRVDDPLEDARYLVDINLTWVDGLIKSVEDNLAKKIYHLQDSDYWAIKKTFVKEGNQVVDELIANPKRMLPQILKSLKERRADLKWFHGASARILLSFEKLESELEYFSDLKMSNAADIYFADYLMSSFAPTNEDVPPLLDGGGKLEVWRIDGSAKTLVPKEDIGKFYSGDSYIVLYIYHQDYLCH